MERTRGPLLVSWLPLLVAAGLASLAGLMLQFSIQRYAGMAVLVPVLNGLGGNIGAVYVSRRSSFLHAMAKEDWRRTMRTLLLIQVVVLSLVCFGLSYFSLLSASWAVILTVAVVGIIQVCDDRDANARLTPFSFRRWRSCR